MIAHSGIFHCYRDFELRRVDVLPVISMKYLPTLPSYSSDVIVLSIVSD